MKRNKGLTFYEQKKKVNSSIVSEILSCLLVAGISGFMALVLTYFLGMSIRVVGSSMEPGLYNGQEILVNRFAYVLSAPKKGDVVVFLPHGNEKSHYYIKRVVAGPGDVIHVVNGVLMVNGEPSDLITEVIDEPGIAANMLTMANGEFFCMGDNPWDGEDSRVANIGPVGESDIVGKVWYHLAAGEEKMGFVK